MLLVNVGRTYKMIIILVLPPVACQTNRAVVPMPDKGDGDAISRCQVLGRAGSFIMWQTYRMQFAEAYFDVPDSEMCF